jgi:hypothetical protein
MLLRSKYSGPKPSNIITTTLCGVALRLPGDARPAVTIVPATEAAAIVMKSRRVFIVNKMVAAARNSNRPDISTEGRKSHRWKKYVFHLSTPCVLSRQRLGTVALCERPPICM